MAPHLVGMQSRISLEATLLVSKIEEAEPASRIKVISGDAIGARACRLGCTYDHRGGQAQGHHQSPLGRRAPVLATGTGIAGIEPNRFRHEFLRMAGPPTFTAIARLNRKGLTKNDQEIRCFRATAAIYFFDSIVI
jgi:hypothetical protein